MKTLFFIIAIGFAELILSWLNHKINILVLSRKALKAAKLDLIANTIAEAIPYFIYVESQNPIYLIPRIIMNTIGTYIVGKRKLKKKKPLYRKKFPVTTA